MSDPRYFQVRCMCCGREERRHASAKRCVCGGGLERLEGPPTDLQRIRALEARLAAATTLQRQQEQAMLAAIERAETVEANFEAWQKLWPERLDAAEGWLKRAEVAEAQCAAMRAALTSIDQMASYPADLAAGMDCAEVVEVLRKTAFDALAPDAGKALLARLERAERIEAAAREAECLLTNYLVNLTLVRGGDGEEVRDMLRAAIGGYPYSGTDNASTVTAPCPCEPADLTGLDALIPTVPVPAKEER